jgi:hypothetical protein
MVDAGRDAARCAKAQIRRADFSWAHLSETELFEKAQEKIACTGIADAKSFDAVYKGIASELRRRGYSPADLAYPEPSAGRETAGTSANTQTSGFRWDQLKDDEFVRIVRAKALECGTSWDRFMNMYKGIRYEMYRRSISIDATDI